MQNGLLRIYHAMVVYYSFSNHRFKVNSTALTSIRDSIVLSWFDAAGLSIADESLAFFLCIHSIGMSKIHIVLHQGGIVVALLSIDNPIKVLPQIN